MKISFGPYAALPRQSAETATIVVLNPGTPPFVVERDDALILSFWDVDRLDPFDRVVAGLLGRWPDLCVKVRETLRGGNWPWRPPLSHDASTIASFVRSLPADVTRIHVGCEYGRSRSRAIAEWIASRHETTATGDMAGTANVRLTTLLRRADGRVIQNHRREIGD